MSLLGNGFHPSVRDGRAIRVLKACPEAEDLACEGIPSTRHFHRRLFAWGGDQRVDVSNDVVSAHLLDGKGLLGGITVPFPCGPSQIFGVVAGFEGQLLLLHVVCDVR